MPNPENVLDALISFQMVGVLLTIAFLLVLIYLKIDDKNSKK